MSRVQNSRQRGNLNLSIIIIILSPTQPNPQNHKLSHVALWSEQYCISRLYSLTSAQRDYIRRCLCLRAVLNWSGVSDSTTASGKTFHKRTVDGKNE